MLKISVQRPGKEQKTEHNIEQYRLEVDLRNDITLCIQKGSIKITEPKNRQGKKMVITINPIVLGNFRKRTFKYPKRAERKTRVAVIEKRSICIFEEN